jgi:p-hydroxybenzoate 3-monooxygenase
LIEERTVELLRPHGLAEAILERGAPNGACEFRADGEAFILDYGALSGGLGSYIYPQQELVGDWAAQLVAAGGDVRFGISAVAVEQDEHGASVTAILREAEKPVSVACEVVAVCDGAASELAAAAGVATVEESYPFRWLALIAAVPPSNERTIYGLHGRGFAGQMRRSTTMTRYMLEVPLGEGLDDWPDDRIWRELQDRLAVTGLPPLEQGEFVERDVLDLRVRVREPMQLGRVFLAGDAAHLITPAGGKGMNLAIQDALELAAGLSERYSESGSDRRLARYSETRLPVIWRYQAFSNLMLSLMHAGAARDERLASPPDSPAGEASFAYRLRRARLDLLPNDPQFSRWFAHAYAGVDE